jgi:hypothetical protein
VGTGKGVGTGAAKLKERGMFGTPKIFVAKTLPSSNMEHKFISEITLHE